MTKTFNRGKFKTTNHMAEWFLPKVAVWPATLKNWPEMLAYVSRADTSACVVRGSCERQLC